MTEQLELFEVTYVDYKIKMNPYAIQFSDEGPDRLTMEQLERHDFKSGISLYCIPIQLAKSP